jgi:hypothetical protein
MKQANSVRTVHIQLPQYELFHALLPAVNNINRHRVQQRVPTVALLRSNRNEAPERLCTRSDLCCHTRNPFGPVNIEMNPHVINCSGIVLVGRQR